VNAGGGEEEHECEIMRRNLERRVRMRRKRKENKLEKFSASLVFLCVLKVHKHDIFLNFFLT
jgi:hypothetical protein